MSDVIVKMKMSPAKAGALYMKSLRQEDEIKELRKKLSDIGEIAYAEHDPDLIGDALYNIQCIC